jgi:hypothetical protein
VVSALSVGIVASGVTRVFAADNPPNSTEAPSKAQVTDETAEKDFVKVSEDALMTMRNVRGARLAIFNGQPDKAETYVDAAVTRVEAAVKDADKYALDTKEPMTEDMYVPFDAGLTVAESFVPSEEKMKHISQANEHLRKGEKKEAIEVLKLGDVDVAIAAKLIPVQLAKQRIDDAAKLVGEGKYYEANLALKSVEDAMVVETFAIDAVPKVKTKG